MLKFPDRLFLSTTPTAIGSSPSLSPKGSWSPTMNKRSLNQVNSLTQFKKQRFKRKVLIGFSTGRDQFDKRLNIPQKIKVDTDLACKVNRQYLIPFLMNKSFKQSLSHSQSTKTLFNELLKSDKLYTKLIKVRRKLDYFKQMLKDAQQSTHVMQIKKKQQRKKIIRAQNRQKVLYKQMAILKIDSLNFKRVYDQLNSFKSNITKDWQQARKMRHYLHTLRADNDQKNNYMQKRKYKGQLMLQSNTILHTRLRQFLKILQNASTNYLVQEQMLIEFFVNQQQNIKECQIVDNYRKQLHSSLQLKLENDKIYKQITESVKELQQIRQYIVYNEKEITGTLTQSLFAVQEFNTNLKSKIEKFIKDSKILNADLIQSLQKIKIFGQSNRKDSSATCATCNKLFLLENNFNWSCRTHSSQYGGGMWWCCGAINKEAKGCKLQQHIPQDDSIHRNILNEYQSAIQCNCCMKNDHKNNQCPKDPNVRTLDDVTQEQQRIENLQLLKQRQKVIVDDLIKLLNQRVGEIGFGQSRVSSFIQSEFSQSFESNLWQKMHEPFYDINHLKQDLSMDDELQNSKNKVNIVDNLDAEFLQEMRMSNRANTQLLFQKKTKKSTFLLQLSNTISKIQDSIKSEQASQNLIEDEEKNEILIL